MSFSAWAVRYVSASCWLYYTGKDTILNLAILPVYSVQSGKGNYVWCFVFAAEDGHTEEAGLLPIIGHTQFCRV